MKAQTVDRVERILVFVFCLIISWLLFIFVVDKACNLIAEAVAADRPVVQMGLTWTAGPNGVSYATAKEIGAWVTGEYARDFGVVVKVRPRAMRDIAARYRGTDMLSRQLRLWRWQKFFGVRSTSWKMVQLVITPPMWDGEKYWLAGLASGVCTVGRERGVATSDAEYYNSSGMARLLHSEYAAYHESAHLLGAQHVTTPVGTLMDPAALAYIIYGTQLPIAPVTVSQVRNCLR